MRSTVYEFFEFFDSPLQIEMMRLAIADIAQPDQVAGRDVGSCVDASG